MDPGFRRGDAKGIHQHYCDAPVVRFDMEKSLKDSADEATRVCLP
jgi:hypothetical protein